MAGNGSVVDVLSVCWSCFCASPVGLGRLLKAKKNKNNCGRHTSSDAENDILVELEHRYLFVAIAVKSFNSQHEISNMVVFLVPFICYESSIFRSRVTL